MLAQEKAATEGKQLSLDLADYFETHPEAHMASVPTEVHVYRYNVTEAFLSSGTPLRRLPFFRKLLEGGGKLSLTDQSHLREYIPHMELREISKVKQELAEVELFSISFDGTTRLGEAVNVVARFCTKLFHLHTRLIRFITIKEHITHQQLAAIISRIVCTEYGIDPERVVGFSRDSVSINGAACDLLCQNPFYRADSIMCISHTLNNCGLWQAAGT